MDKRPSETINYRFQTAFLFSVKQVDGFKYSNQMMINPKKVDKFQTAFKPLMTRL